MRTYSIFNSIENLFIGLQCFCVCSNVKRKCLFMSFVNFFYLFLSLVFALIFMKSHIVSLDVCLCLLNFKFLEKKDYSFFTVKSPMIIIVVQIYISLFCRGHVSFAKISY